MTVKVDESGSGVTRASLLTRARRQDSAAWNELVQLYRPLVLHWATRCGLDSHAAADCSQDVFAAVAKSLDRFSPTRRSGSFRAWLWTVTSNKIRDAMRREGRHPIPRGGSSAAQLLRETAEAGVPEEQPTEIADIHGLVARAMDQVRDEFAARTWQIFDRSVIDDLATAEVAEQFGVSPATVRQTRSRILRRLRQQLGDLDD